MFCKKCKKEFDIRVGKHICDMGCEDMNIKIIRRPVDKRAKVKIYLEGFQRPISLKDIPISSLCMSTIARDIDSIYNSQEQGEVDYIEIKGNTKGVYGKNGIYVCPLPDTIVISMDLYKQIQAEIERQGA